MREINEIIVHCTATPPNFMADATPAQRVDEVRRWHVEDNGWSDIGYHYLIDRGGQLLNGRPISKAGAHVKGHNSDTIGVSLFGGKGGTKDQAFEDNFTPKQEGQTNHHTPKPCQQHRSAKYTAGCSALPSEVLLK